MIQDNTILLESINDGIMAINNNSQVLFANKKLSKKFFPLIEEVTNKKIEHVFSDEEILSAFQECLETHEVQKIYDYKIKSNNRDLYFEIAISPIWNEQISHIDGAIGVFRNVTEAKLTEQMRVDFVANVSHEIRTPLTSIKGFAQVLEVKKKDLPDNIQDYISKISSNAERLQLLFNDLLNLSVIESKHRLQKKKILLKPLVENVRSSLIQNYSHKNITIKFDLQVTEVNADNKLFEQALINLIDNACKYAGETPVIKVSSFKKEDKILIKVSDDGPGISKEHLDRIFERFYRVDAARSKEDDNNISSGTGLGLSIVKHIINKHKGRIWAESKPNQGTVFFIELPVKKYRLDESFR